MGHPDILNALTVWQPWATLIMVGAKPFEFRGHRAPRSIIGKRLVIHAGVRRCPRDEIMDLIDRLQDERDAWTTCLKKELAMPVLEQALEDAAKPAKPPQRKPADLFGEQPDPQAYPLHLPLGAGLGTVIVGEPVNGHVAAAQMGGPPVNDSNRGQHANWGWPMLEVERWPDPVTRKGAQGIWRWDGGDAERFASAL